MKIVIVEDEQVVALDLEESLSRFGYEIGGIATQGSEALRLAAEIQPDLVLMDIQLQGEIDGITAAKEIRSRWNIPVIFLTAFGGRELIERAASARPYGYLIKPFHGDELNAMVLMAVQQHKFETESAQVHRNLALLLGRMRQGLIATDPAGLIRYVNSAAEKLTGWAAEEAAGKPIEQVLRLKTTDGEETECGVGKALKTGRAQGSNQSVLLNRSSEPRTIRHMAAPVLDQSGENMGAVVVFSQLAGDENPEPAQTLDLHAIPDGVAPAARLSAREKEVLRLIAEGKSTKEIAFALGITFKTAVTHRTHILEKLKVHETASLVRHAIRTGLIKA